MEHHFVGPRYTVGIEEELMILNSSSLDLTNAIDSILGAEPPSGEIKPEFLESVLEIATAPCADVPAVGAELVSLRGLARDRAHARNLEIGAAGTDRKSTRLNSSHANISYAVFCLKKKTNKYN